MGLHTDQRLSGRAGELQTLEIRGAVPLGLTGGSVAFVPVTEQCGSISSSALMVSSTVSAVMEGHISADVLLTADGRSTGVPLAPGAYRGCYCSEEHDISGVAGVSFRYHASRSKATGFYVPAGASSKVCRAMCSGGCLGSGCFCNGYTEADAENGELLCLPAAECRALCEADATCTGFATSNQRCQLVQGAVNSALQAAGGDFVQSDDWNFYSAVRHRPCVTRNRFTYDFGTLWITRRPHLGNNWVLAPNAAGSIEVLGDQLDVLHDRIVMIPANGTCGVSRPIVDPLVEPYRNAKTLMDIWYSNETTRNIATSRAERRHAALMFFNTWIANSEILDRPSDVNEPGYSEESVAGGLSQEYGQRSGRFCDGAHLDVLSRDILAPYQCYSRCSDGCSGPDCGCSGFTAGYDSEESYPLCVNQTTCLALCALEDACFGIDMHTSRTRCFLNSYECIAPLEAGTLVESDDYDMFFKRPYSADDGTSSTTTTTTLPLSVTPTSSCPRGDFCRGVGDVLKAEDCDGDGEPDWVCLGQATFSVLSSAAACGEVDTCNGCTRGDFCLVSGGTLGLRDCDSDGLVDLTCSAAGGQFGALLSAGQCGSTWPTGTCGAPPTALLEVGQYQEVGKYVDLGVSQLASPVPYAPLSPFCTGSDTRQAAADGTPCDDNDPATVGEQCIHGRCVARHPGGLSCEGILRFRHVHFRSGGTFKACFCDTELLIAPTCTSTDDYKIDLGTIHVSGVSCLLTEPKFQRGTCVHQYWGGLRCHAVAPATPSCAPQPGRVVPALVTPPAPQVSTLSTWCMYGPAEQTRAHAPCLQSWTCADCTFD